MSKVMKMTPSNQESSRQELIALGLQKKKGCEDRASAIVLELLDNAQDREWIRDSINFITLGHYDDTVTERSIDKQCGYILCSSPLGAVPSRKYRISLKRKEVIDLDERKPFCSELCYKSSRFLRNQVLSAPLWLRNEEDKIKAVFFDEQETTEPDEQETTEPDEQDPVKEEKPMLRLQRPKRSQQSGQENSLQNVLKSIKAWWSLTATSFIWGPKNEVEALAVDVENVLSIHQGSVDEHERLPAIPLVEKTSQLILRRSIVLKNLENGFARISDHLNLKWHEISVPMKELVDTFHLTAENITLRPNEWMIVFTILVQVLGRRSTYIQSQLVRPTAEQFLSQLWLSLEFDQETFASDLAKSCDQYK